MGPEPKILRTRPGQELPPLRTAPPKVVEPERAVQKPNKQNGGGGGLGEPDNAADYQGDETESLPEVTVTDAGHNGGRPIMNDPELMQGTDPMIAPAPLIAPGDPTREQMRPGKRRK